MRGVIGLLLCLGLHAAVRGDEAVLPGGKRLEGSLVLDRNGAPQFRPTQGEPRPLSELRQVNFQPTVSPPRLAAWHHVRLANDQELTGELLGLDKRELILRTAWAERVVVPRSAIVSLGHLPGLLPVAGDDFESGLGAWKASNKPTLGGPATSGKLSLLLGPGQAVERHFDPPVAEGQLGINFRPGEAARGVTWVAELEFVEGKKARVLKIVLGGDEGEDHTVTAEGLEGQSESVKAARDWRRLHVGWRPTSVRVNVDQAVVWYRLEGGAGSLRRVRFEGRAKETEVGGTLALDDFGMERALEGVRRPPGDPSQDEVWLVSGDQLFGAISSADARGLTLEAAFGTRKLAWTAIRSVWPRTTEAKPRPREGDGIRLELENTALSLPDRLDGVLTGLDEKSLRVRHADLGELPLPRGALRRVEPRPGR